MALRIKCSCGKSLKVPSQLADKKLACPACQRPFRIPAEKFRAAAPTGAGPGAAAPAPRAAPKPAVPSKPADAPVPAELDILPANLDWTGDIASSQSDILSGIIPSSTNAATPATLAGPGCPSCRQVLPAGAKLCVSCGYDLRTGKHIAAAAAAQPAPAAPAPTVSYAGGFSPALIGTRRPDRDVIQSSPRGFWADAFRAFAYPFLNLSNGVTFGGIVFLDSLRILLVLAMPWVPCIVVPFFIFLMAVCIRGWICAVMLSIIQDTAAGSEDLPGVKMEDGVLEDVIKPLFKYIGAAACALLPAAIYAILLVGGALPATTFASLNLVLLIGAGVFVWPMLLMLFAFNEAGQIIRIDLIITTIFRTFLPYLGLWLMLMLTSFDTVVALAAIGLLKAQVSVALPRLPQIPGVTGELIYNVISLYLAVISMRMIGLYYLHYKKRFALVME